MDRLSQVVKDRLELISIIVCIFIISSRLILKDEFGIFLFPSLCSYLLLKIFPNHILMLKDILLLLGIASIFYFRWTGSFDNSKAAVSLLLLLLVLLREEGGAFSADRTDG